MNKFRDEQIGLCTSLDNRSPIRIQALFELMNIADNDSLDTIFDVMRDDPCELVRHEAAFVLGEMASDRAKKELRNAFNRDDSLVVKHECLMSLGTIGREEDLEFVEKYIDEN